MYPDPSRPERLNAVELQRQPDPETTGWAGELGTVVTEVGKSEIQAVLEVLDRPESVSSSQVLTVAHQERARAERQEETLVWVEDQRVSSLDPDQSASTSRSG